MRHVSAPPSFRASKPSSRPNSSGPVRPASGGGAFACLICILFTEGLGFMGSGFRALGICAFIPEFVAFWAVCGVAELRRQGKKAFSAMLLSVPWKGRGLASTTGSKQIKNTKDNVPHTRLNYSGPRSTWGSSAMVSWWSLAGRFMVVSWRVFAPPWSGSLCLVLVVSWWSWSSTSSWASWSFRRDGPGFRGRRGGDRRLPALPVLGDPPWKNGFGGFKA